MSAPLPPSLQRSLLGQPPRLGGISDVPAPRDPEHELARDRGHDGAPWVKLRISHDEGTHLFEVLAACTLGRVIGNDIIVEHDAIDPMHIEIVPDADGVVVINLGSTGFEAHGALQLGEAFVPWGTPFFVGETLMLVAELASGEA